MKLITKYGFYNQVILLKKRTLLMVGIVGSMLLLSVLSASTTTRASNSIVRRPPWEQDNPPTVTILSPSNGATVSGIVTISVSASDDKGVTGITIKINGNTVATGSTYDWDTSGLADGTYTIAATATDTIGQTSTDTINVYIGGGSSGGDGIVNKYAVIVGISDYKAISDLSYCDEDASEWYDYLAGKGYSITLLGDNHPDTYPVWDGYATENNVRSALASIFANADEDDIVAFATSGHGGQQKLGSGRSRTYKEFLCMWDCGDGEVGYDGYIFDDEFETIMAASVSQTFVFMDHCNSGGIAFTRPNTYMTTTCTADGYGYDDGAHQNGAWTYWFLEYSLIGQLGGTGSMEAAFDIAAGVYPYSGDDAPMEFDGFPGDFFL